MFSVSVFFCFIFNFEFDFFKIFLPPCEEELPNINNKVYLIKKK